MSFPVPLEEAKIFHFKSTLPSFNKRKVFYAQNKYCVNILNEDEAIVGAAEVYNEENDVVVECRIDYQTPERLSVETDNPIFLNPSAAKIGENSVYISHFTVSSSKENDDSIQITKYNVLEE